MKFEIEGEVVKLFDTKQVSEKFTKREFVLFVEDGKYFKQRLEQLTETPAAVIATPAAAPAATKRSLLPADQTHTKLPPPLRVRCSQPQKSGFQWRAHGAALPNGRCRWCR